MQTVDSEIVDVIKSEYVVLKERLTIKSQV